MALRIERAVMACSRSAWPRGDPATGPIAMAVRAAIERGSARFDHSAWDRLLAAAVRDGLVDYRRMEAGRRELDGYLDSIARVRLDTLAGPELEALLVNAY